ncbi:MAG: twin-arginine translocase subunit TatC [Planctomycetes bacterium]|nr:twin-arginine translocase subunit TatC [Planctomycetota bacterium]
MVSLDDPAVRAAYDEEPLPRMSFGDHLDELRSRLIKALLAVVVAIVALLPFKGPVQDIIVEPYRLQWRNGFTNWVAQLEQREVAGSLDEEGREFLAYCRKHRDAIFAGTKEYTYLLKEKTGYPVPYSLFATGGIEDMFAFMWASLIFALVLASPVVIWQVWAFLAAGLYARERAVFYRYFPLMLVLFTAGVLFGYFVALPYSLGFLIGMMDPAQVNAILSVGQFLNLLLALTAAMGLVFQLPLVMVALQRVGLVTHRAFVKNWRLTVLILFIAAAVFTPPEPVSMLLMSMPMLLLYGLGLGLTWMGRRHEAPAVEVAT